MSTPSRTVWYYPRGGIPAPAGKRGGKEALYGCREGDVAWRVVGVERDGLAKREAFLETVRRVLILHDSTFDSVE